VPGAGLHRLMCASPERAAKADHRLQAQEGVRARNACLYSHRLKVTLHLPLVS